MQPEVQIQKVLRVPANMQSVRARPMVTVPIPDGVETPFIHPDDPQSKQLQQVWTAHVQVFNMSKVDDVKAYEKVWQLTCDGLGHVSESKTDYNVELGAYLVFCRWSEITFVLPPALIGQQVDPPASQLPPSA